MKDGLTPDDIADYAGNISATRAGLVVKIGKALEAARAAGAAEARAQMSLAFAALWDTTLSDGAARQAAINILCPEPVTAGDLEWARLSPPADSGTEGGTK